MLIIRKYWAFCFLGQSLIKRTITNYSLVLKGRSRFKTDLSYLFQADESKLLPA